MAHSFADLYSDLIKDVFTQQAQQQLQQGVDGMSQADAYAEQGKPEFTLAYLLLIDAPEAVKYETLAHSYERRALLSEQKAKDFDQRFRRAFPLILLQVQKDRMAAQQIRLGRRVRPDSSKHFPVT